MIKSICVYCSSSNAIDARHFETAQRLGQLIAERDATLVFGGGSVGLMGEVARAVHDGGGTVVGVIPEALKAREGVAYDLADELIVTSTMQERKAGMYQRADAFAVLPGGFGTLEEFLEILTLKHLDYHEKPIALINTDGFYDRLTGFFEQLRAFKFASKRSEDESYHLAPSPDDALDYFDAWAEARAAENRPERRWWRDRSKR